MGATYDPSPPSSPIGDAEKASLLPYYTDDPNGVPIPVPDFADARAGAGAFDESHRTLRVGVGRGHGRLPRAGGRAKSCLRAAWSKFGWAIKTVVVVAALWIASHALFRRGHWRACGGPGRGRGRGKPEPVTEPLPEPEPVAPLYRTSRVHDTPAGVYVASNTSFPLVPARELVLEIPPELEGAGDGELYVSYTDDGRGEVIVEYTTPLEVDTTVSNVVADAGEAELYTDGETVFLHVTPPQGSKVTLYLVLPTQHQDSPAPIPRIRTNLVPHYDDVIPELELLSATKGISGDYNVTEHGELSLHTFTGSIDVDVHVRPPPWGRPGPGRPRGPPHRKEESEDALTEDDEVGAPRDGPHGPPSRRPDGPRDGPGGPGGPDGPRGPPRGPPGGSPPHAPPRGPPPHDGPGGPGGDHSHPPHSPHRGPAGPPPPPPTRICAFSKTGDVTLRLHAPAPPPPPKRNSTRNAESVVESEEDESEVSHKHKHKHPKHKHGDHEPPHPPHSPHGPHGPHGPPHHHFGPPRHVMARTVHGAVEVDASKAHFIGFFRATTIEGKVKVTAGEGKEIVVLREWVGEKGGGFEGLVRPVRKGNNETTGAEGEDEYDDQDEHEIDGRVVSEWTSDEALSGDYPPPPTPDHPRGPSHPPHPPHRGPPGPPHGPGGPGGPGGPRRPGPPPHGEPPLGPPGSSHIIAGTVKGDVRLRL